MEIIWRNVFVYIYLHATALYGFYLEITFSCFPCRCANDRPSGQDKIKKFISTFSQFVGFLSFILFKQDDILKWSREHRVHHKFSDTDADPYNSRRGFFFSHIGWLMHKKHPEFYRMEKTIDVSDLLQDPVVVFQQKYILKLNHI